jgi:hypothetical protein
MYVCILNQDGEILMHRHMKASPDALLKVLTPYREDVVVAVEWTLHLGPGSLTCVPRKGFLLSSAMRCT